jgi:hypothetical protein
VTIAANVADATHGETVTEVLGSGDGSQPNQNFKLKQTPLTYIRSTAPGGAESTLQMRVNDLLWHEVSTLFEREARERIFTTEPRIAVLKYELHVVERMIRAFGVIFNLWLFSNFKCVRNDCCLSELSSS